MGDVKNKTDGEQFRKLFIGGLSLNTTDESLKQFYSQFGELLDCVVMRDNQTKKSRGFGFVSFSSMEEVDKAMNARPHEIDGKQVDPKRAVPRDQSSRTESNISTKRLYVSGVRDGHTEENFNEHFSNYGIIEKIDIICDKTTQKLRGFAFVSFNDYDAVDKCVLQKSHTIADYRCDVKKALSKEDMAKAQQLDRDRQERAMRSRGMGVARGGGSAGGSYGGGYGTWDGAAGGWGGAPPQWGLAGGAYAAGYGGYGSGVWGSVPPAPGASVPPTTTASWNADSTGGAYSNTGGVGARAPTGGVAWPGRY